MKKLKYAYIKEDSNREGEYSTAYNALVPPTVDELPRQMATIRTCREIDNCPTIYLAGVQKFLQKLKIR